MQNPSPELKAKAAELVQGAVVAWESKDSPKARAKLRASVELEDSLAARGLWARMNTSPETWAGVGPGDDAIY